MNIKSFLLIAAVLVVVAPASQAVAQGNCYGGGWGCGWGYGYLYNQLDYNVPYFAAHPPVYYSYPVPRTYGYSPFAYPPGVMTPEVVGEEAIPLQIINPYVPRETETPEEGAADRSTAVEHSSGPLVIHNPYVVGDRTVAQAGR